MAVVFGQPVRIEGECITRPHPSFTGAHYGTTPSILNVEIAERRYPDIDYSM
jgi:hypothetical protein